MRNGGRKRKRELQLSAGVLKARRRTRRRQKGEQQQGTVCHGGGGRKTGSGKKARATGLRSGGEVSLKIGGSKKKGAGRGAGESQGEGDTASRVEPSAGGVKIKNREKIRRGHRSFSLMSNDKTRNGERDREPGGGGSKKGSGKQGRPFTSQGEGGKQGYTKKNLNQRYSIPGSPEGTTNK